MRAVNCQSLHSEVGAGTHLELGHSLECYGVDCLGVDSPR